LRFCYAASLSFSLSLSIWWRSSEAGKEREEKGKKESHPLRKAKAVCSAC